MSPHRADITQLLRQSRAGDRAAIDQVIPLVYNELRRLAGAHLQRQAPGHTLQPTALVHEAYLRLAGSQPDLRDQTHFFSVAATIMRQVLVDHARSRGYLKRGAAAKAVALDASRIASPDRGAEVVALDDALNGLAKRDARKARWQHGLDQVTAILCDAFTATLPTLPTKPHIIVFPLLAETARAELGGYSHRDGL